MGIIYKDAQGVEVNPSEHARATSAHITAFGLGDYSVQVQTAVEQGFKLSERNDDYPQGFVSSYQAVFRKEEAVKAKTLEEKGFTKPEGKSAADEAVSSVALEPEATKEEVKELPSKEAKPAPAPKRKGRKKAS